MLLFCKPAGWEAEFRIPPNIWILSSLENIISVFCPGSAVGLLQLWLAVVETWWLLSYNSTPFSHTLMGESLKATQGAVCSPGAQQHFLSKAPDDVSTLTLFHTHRWNSHPEQFGTQFLAKGHFNMQPEARIKPATFQLDDLLNSWDGHFCPFSRLKQWGVFKMWTL